MDVGSVTQQTTTQSGNAAKQLSGNFDTFLSLLTAQLQNQDPMSPMDSNQFTQQLVQFSQVEQQINSNKNLETLISMTKARGNADAVSYLGKTITLTDGGAPLQGGEAHWAYALEGTSAKTQLTVTNAAGKVVYTAPGETAEGLHPLDWDGKDSNGNALADGAYTLKVTAIGADGEAVASQVASQGVVSEVDLTGSEPTLMIGPMRVPFSKAMLVSAN